MQCPGVNYDETFSPVVMSVIVHTIMSLDLSWDWPVHHLNIKNAFLHDTLTEIFYCIQPTRFFDPAQADLVYCLNRSLYGLKQAPRAWYNMFASYMLSLGFVKANSDTSLFIFLRSSKTVSLLLYVNDIVLTTSSTELL
jgi:hypothetical protein